MPISTWRVSKVRYDSSGVLVLNDTKWQDVVAILDHLLARYVLRPPPVSVQHRGHTVSMRLVVLPYPTQRQRCLVPESLEVDTPTSRQQVQEGEATDCILRSSLLRMYSLAITRRRLLNGPTSTEHHYNFSWVICAASAFPTAGRSPNTPRALARTPHPPSPRTRGEAAERR